MSKRTKLKLRNMQMFMTKYVFNSKFIVRNLLAVTVLVTLVAIVAGTVMLIGSSENEEKTAPQEMAVIYTYNTAELDSNSISIIKASLDDDNQETVVEANETQMVSETTGEFDTRFIATGSNINIREEASTESAIVGTLNQGDVGDIISSDGEWLKISSGSVTGYVKAEFVLTGSAAEEYAVDYQTSKGVVTESGVYIRQDASTEAEIIGTANVGDSYEVNTSTTDTLDGWICVYLEDDSIGYICSDYVKIETGYRTATPVTQEEESMTNEDETETDTQETVEEETTEETVEDTTTEDTTEDTTDNQVEMTYTTREAVTLSDEDINLMAAVIYLESGNESYDGQLAVANVIINRLVSGSYGSTIYDVVYAPYQFTVVNSDSMADLVANGAPDSCVAIAKEAAGGKNNVGSFMCFKPSWNVDTTSLSSYMTIGNHVFY